MTNSENTASVSGAYQARIAQLNIEIRALKRRSRFFLLGKIVSFSLAVLFCFRTYDAAVAANIAGIAGFWILYISLYLTDDRCMKRIAFLEAMRTVCNNEIACLQGDFSPFPDGSSYVDPSHEFSYDLDLFGPQSLFHRINRTVSRGGSDRLAHKLGHPGMSRGEIEDNREAIAELAGKEEFRIRLMAQKRADGRLENLSGSCNEKQYRNLLYRTPLAEITVGLTLLVLVLCCVGILPWALFSAMFLLQLMLVSLVGKATAKAGLSVGRLHGEYARYVNILGELRKQEFSSAKMKRICGELFGEGASSLEAFRKLSSLLEMFEQRGGAILYLLLNGLFLFDVLLVKSFLKWNRKYGALVDGWTDRIWETDALCSMATYAWNHPENCRAEVLEPDAEEILQAQGVWHPFLDRAKAVPNDFVLRRKNIAIVTGANMAGKSTFLRTMGVSYLMAANGMPVCARSFRFSVVSLFSSMRTSDNLSKDISYFNAELLRLKQLILHVKQHAYSLIILDEILKGTNSMDKLKGSMMFLQEISRYNVSALIATHDLELSKLEEQDARLYSNYCFEIGLSEEISYSYRIGKGVAQNLNASYLLANILRTLHEE